MSVLTNPLCHAHGERGGKQNKMKSETLELVQQQPQGMSLSGLNIESLLNKAIDAKSAVEVMERLQSMRREMKDEQAKEAFDEAMSAFQSECPVVMKDKGVPDRSGKVAYKYAPIEAIEIQIRPILRKYGFSHTFDTDIASEQGWVIAKCLVTHRAGHSRVSTSKFPLGTKTAIMSDTQAYAAALTFANRRVLCNAYGLILAGEDMDGRTGKLKPSGPSTLRSEASVKDLATELWHLLGDICKGDKDWVRANQWLWKNEVLDGGIPEEAPNLSPARFKEVIEKAKGLV